MTQFHYEKDTDPAAIAGQSIAVVGYVDPGLPRALNLHAGEGVRAMEHDWMGKLGTGAAKQRA